MIMQLMFTELLLRAGHVLRGFDTSLDTDLPVHPNSNSVGYWLLCTMVFEGSEQLCHLYKRHSSWRTRQGLEPGSPDPQVLGRSAIVWSFSRRLWIRTTWLHPRLLGYSLDGVKLRDQDEAIAFKGESLGPDLSVQPHLGEAPEVLREQFSSLASSFCREAVG